MAIVSMDMSERVAARVASYEARREKYPGSVESRALAAFEAGQNFYPTFELGLGAGNPRGALVSKDGYLYFVRRLPEYRYQLLPIRENEEAARVARMKEVA